MEAVDAVEGESFAENQFMASPGGLNRAAKSVIGSSTPSSGRDRSRQLSAGLSAKADTRFLLKLHTRGRLASTLRLSPR